LSGLSLSGTWRHINEVPLEDAETSALVTDLLLDAKDYFDFSGTWDIRENVTFRAGVNNVFDEDPPLNGGSSCPAGPCNGNTWPGLYDAVGRYIFFGITADF
jgi:outer membrane receptor protein involved in Fe transport